MPSVETGETGDKGICLEEKMLHLGYATFEMFVRNLKGEVKQSDYLLNTFAKSMAACLNV